MASFEKLKSGYRASVYRRGVRVSAVLPTQKLAEQWAKNTEDTILGKSGGTPIQLTGRELLFLRRRSKERAIERGIDYFLNAEDIEKMFLATNGRCAVSGILFNRFRPINCTKRPWYPSLDRIDSSKPYTVDNCRFVCVAVNMAMGEWGEWVLKAIANGIVLGEQVNLSGLEEAPGYSFPKIGLDSNLTYRQQLRRRQREKFWKNHEPITNDDASPL